MGKPVAAPAGAPGSRQELGPLKPSPRANAKGIAAVDVATGAPLNLAPSAPLAPLKGRPVTAPQSAAARVPGAGRVNKAPADEPGSKACAVM